MIKTLMDTDGESMGGKKVKNSLYPRNYYRCNVTDCPAKKFMEKIIENGKEKYKTVYKGQHCHEPPTMIETPKIENQESFKNIVYNKMINSNQDSSPTHNENAKRKNGPTFVVELNDQVNSRCDGYHWRKYGEKPLKSSSIARSYYKCVDCNVKKQVEISSGRVLVTYEGVHTHTPSDVVVLDDPSIPKKRKMQISNLLNNPQHNNTNNHHYLLPNLHLNNINHHPLHINNTQNNGGPLEENNTAASLLDLSQSYPHNNNIINNHRVNILSQPPRTMEPQFMPSTIIYPYYSAPPIVSMDNEEDYFTNKTIQNLLFLKNISSIENN
eukprot:TRINITY_DN3362_c0_g1_i3.p1 TRINITY_DN3362_c0_g1~~TRINITY_DN3362_c0_g1_i3.p1  ORF type:complete len:326 (-),score=88.09 TRINITY_DN3362_c0_g1_i3:184-1161(-)